ncbi:hypothetical protein QGM61_06455 [Pseudohongiella sp. SYSU M77423]|uniref:hypothetical protein n=1 Tax=Pseudohongiella sp. SYSU M77423 TaxID=3042312 RepID=UPI002480CFA9|nr:hypothetical protein [Pseudohongiella sp. SYSU M77423]MDH7943456.1 hypothetical protein [Pseudohongiella sp. SYSU M77423]
MYLIVLFLLALAFALPTFGASLIAFFVIKRIIDKKATNAILNAAVFSLETQVTQELFHINRAAIHLVFDKFCIKETENVRNYNAMDFYWGIFQHPMINNGEKFSLRTIYVPRGKVHVMASPGIDNEVLSDYIPGVGNFSDLINRD